jgi:hypothetical protein
MERVVEQTQTMTPPPGINAYRLEGQLDPIPRFLWNTPTAMHDLTPEDLESTIREWLDLEVIREVAYQAHREEQAAAPAEIVTEDRTARTKARRADEDAANEVGNQISRLRSQVGFLRSSLEDAFGDLLRSKDAGAKPGRKSKKASFSEDQIEGKVKKALAGIKADDLIKEPANTSIMIRRGPYLTRGDA